MGFPSADVLRFPAAWTACINREIDSETPPFPLAIP